MAAMVRAVLVAVLLLQCCNAILAARLLEGDIGSWLQGRGGAAAVRELILQVLQGPGSTNSCTNNPGGSGSGGNCIH
ncbi:hypothetical protein GUJ93_ZPchr0006g43808 [Zizania palustris]|uniref:Uncharacterized protein n=1 Tax=Zizania palustris TaxID=103762 RepID=A0A8J5T9U0_ZIZPA|nr:hypothetical protein GUJ93_ZPchr0006g43808 [Zizania palustris]